MLTPDFTQSPKLESDTNFDIHAPQFRHRHQIIITSISRPGRAQPPKQCAANDRLKMTSLRHKVLGTTVPGAVTESATGAGPEGGRLAIILVT